jgi:hypothetical protein
MRILNCGNQCARAEGGGTSVPHSKVADATGTAVIDGILKLLLGMVVLLAELRTSFSHPGAGIIMDKRGQVFFTDTGEGVWRIDSRKRVSLFSGSALHWLEYDPEGHFARSPAKFGHFERITPTGTKPAILLCSDYPFVITRDGSVCYPDFSRTLRIIRRTAKGTEAILAAATDSETASHLVTGMVESPDGAIYFTDIDPVNGTHAVRKIGPHGSIITFVEGFLSKMIDGHTAAKEAGHCRGLAIDQKKNIYVVASGLRCVVKITPDRAVTKFFESPSPWSPTALTFHQTDAYILEYSDFPPGWNQDDRKGWVPRVRKLRSSGKIETLATVPRVREVLGADAW